MDLNNLTQEQVEVKELLAQGKSAREVARIMWDRESRESTIRNWVKKGLLDESEITEEDIELTDEKLEHLCTNADWDISNLAKRLRNAQRTNNQLRKVHRSLFDGNEADEAYDFTEIIRSAIELSKDEISVNVTKPVIMTPKTVEIVFSDLQIGKISEHWNTEIAKRTMKYYGKEVLKIVKEVQPEKINFCSLGDIIECAHKHKQQSAYSTDTSNAEQLANAIHGIWWDILKPLVETGIPLEFVGVYGNHGADSQAGFDMFKGGRYCYDWVIYSALKDMCAITGADHVTWNLPEGCFATTDIYGQLTVLEHGYLTKGPSETALLNTRNKRAGNLQKYVHRLLIGDMHHVCNYDNGRMAVNGAFFGVAFKGIEYSGISGFHAMPGQLVFIHEPTTGEGQNTVVDTRIIQVAKGYY